MSSEIVLINNPDPADFTEELPDRDPPYLEELHGKISSEVFEQDRAVRKILQRIALIDSGKQKRPSPLFFAGPPGSGKSYLTEVAAKAWLGEPENGGIGPLVSIAGENFRESHTISALLGAPAGYVGHGGSGTSATRSPLERLGVFDENRKFEVLDRVAQRWVDNEIAKYKGDSPDTLRQFLEGIKEDVVIHKFEELEGQGPFIPPRSVLRVDEFEKMHEEVQKQFLTILNDGYLQLRNSGSRIIDFRGCLIVFTSNIGTGEITKLIEQKPVGFRPVKKEEKAEKAKDQQIYETVKREVEKQLPPELYSRIGHDGLVVFHKLSRRGFVSIIDKEIRDLQQEFSFADADSGLLLIQVTSRFKQFILDEADSPKEGARMITRLIDKYMRLPLAKRISSGDLVAGDMLLFDVEDGKVRIKMMPRPEGMELHSLSPGHTELDEKALQEELFSDLGDVYRMILEEDAKQKKMKRKKKPPASSGGGPEITDEPDEYDGDDEDDLIEE